MLLVRIGVSISPCESSYPPTSGTFKALTYGLAFRFSMYCFQAPDLQLGVDLDNYRYPDINKMTLGEAVKTFVKY